MNPTRLTFRTADIEHIAVVVQIASDSPYNTHTGVIYKTSGVARHLHLRWHRWIEDCKPEGHFAIAILDIDSDRAQFLARLCLRIASRYSGDKPTTAEEYNRLIPYSLKHPENAIFNTATGEAVNCGDGLNCCSFVLVLFATYGTFITHPNYWPFRDDDKAWHAVLVDWLKGGDPAHAERISEQIGCQRVRPEELGGACLCFSMPASFLEAEQASRFVLQYLSHDFARTGFL